MTGIKKYESYQRRRMCTEQSQGSRTAFEQRRATGDCRNGRMKRKKNREARRPL